MICEGEVSVPIPDSTMLIIKRGKGYRGFRYCKPCQIVTIRDQVHIEYISWLTKVRALHLLAIRVSEGYPTLGVHLWQCSKGVAT